MYFDEFEKYLLDISKLEFNERNHEIQRSVTQLKGEMNSREILNSSITLQHLSEFFGSEYIVRCEFIRNFIVGHANILDLASNDDPITSAKIFFQKLSTAEKDSVEKMYNNSASQIVDSQQGSHPKDLKSLLLQRIDNSIVKNNLYVELEFKTIKDAQSSGKEVFQLNPNIYGIGVNLKELWARYF